MSPDIDCSFSIVRAQTLPKAPVGGSRHPVGGEELEVS
jgi:hypothetical protein